MRWILLSTCFLVQYAALGVWINEPALRPSPYFGCLSGLNYTDVDNLGQHSYGNFRGGKNALVYTAKAGYIDLGHLREAADRTRYLFEVCYENILDGEAEFTFKIIEPARYHVSMTYPSNWHLLSMAEQHRIAREVSIDLGQRFAHLSTIWHEIVTWYGYASTGLLSEKASSFSWEDGYSDLLGTKLAAEVLRDNTKPFDDGMTDIIAQELAKLDPQSVETAKKATGIIEGKWFSGRYPFLSMKRRSFDVGFDDGAISPFRVPGVCDGAAEVPCRVPTLDALQRNGFGMRLTLTPKESERSKILRIVHMRKKGDTLEPEADFPVIIEHIRKEAIRKDGRNVDKPVL
ncbi:MAG: DUF4056 domain-containing protein [Phycisphaerae bacterium]|nr:DUF4056 domain-containing protein [Phycisphaerae bacterium]